MRPALPICVTGMGCVTAAGRDVADNLRALEQGTLAPLHPEWPGVERRHPAFRCPDPELPPWLRRHAPDGRTSGELTRSVRLAAWAAAQALEDAGIGPEDLTSIRVGVCLGTSVGASLDFFDFYQEQRAGLSPSLDVIHTYLISNPALALARLLGARGPAQTVTNACSSGADAIGLAAHWIRSGLCDVVLAGGTDALSRITYLGFGSLQLLSPEPCRPFDKTRQGLNLGEGAGMLVLESRERTRASGRKAAGFILGYGTCSDAHHLTAPHPECRGLSTALEQALSQAGVTRSDIAFINAHGTATPTNDATEGAFLRNEFPRTPFIATKGGTGHTLGAAGAIEAVFSLGHLAHGALPPSPGFTEKDPAIQTAPVSEPTEIRGAIALSQSLAFGGNNSILLLGKGERTWY